MILFYILKAFNALVFGLISIIPTFETPVWLATQLPDILFRVASFNLYLPIYETVTAVLFLIGFTLSYKLIKVILNAVHIDLNV